MEPRALWRCVSLSAEDVVDGDTIRVLDPNPHAWGANLGRLRVGSDGRFSVRLAGLDAPELHYPAGPAQLVHQPLAWATAAQEALLRALALPPAAEAHASAPGSPAPEIGRAHV